MQKFNHLLKAYLYIFTTMVALFSSEVYAQLPVCSGPGSGLIYYLSGNTIYNLDPTQPVSATNPTTNTISPPVGASGIAVSNNINGAGASPTFYVNVSGNYQYYDGAIWVNTGHSIGSAAAVNFGAGGPYVYSLVGGSGEIYKYDGTGNATLLNTISDFGGGGPYDLVGDCNGNYYILRVNSGGAGQYLRKYDPNGNLVQSWTISGATSSSSGGGMAIIGNKVYYHNGSGFWGGTMTGTNVNFTQIPGGLSPGPSDFSSCPIGGSGGSTGTATASVDTLFSCGVDDLKKLFAVNVTSGNVVQWSVISGNANITGTGDTVQVGASSYSKILLTVTDTSDCGSTGLDTVEVFVTTANIDAGSDPTIIACNNYIDTITAQLSDTFPGVQYTVQWQPQNKILGYLDRLQPIVNPTEKTKFIVTVTAPSGNGGCIWRDTVEVDLKRQLEAYLDLEDTVKCTGDTAYFNAYNTMILFTDGAQYDWDFGDMSTGQGVRVGHAFSEEGDQYIRLIVTDGTGCMDTVFYTLNGLEHPPLINIGDDTSICNDVLITIPLIDEKRSVRTYLWSDGSTKEDKLIGMEGTYILTVKNNCSTYTDTIVIGTKDCSVWYPSGFTPNSDGRNDIARIRSRHPDEIENFNLLIVNRFGEVVFETKDHTKGWDGTYNGLPAPIGSYYYFIKYKIKGGTKDEYFMKGDLTLIR